MFRFARWNFITRHERRKFDSIADGHKAALIAMGVIEDAEEATLDTGPECPPELLTTFEKYRDVKFTRRVDDDEVKLYPRGQLSWSDLVAYSSISGQNIGMFESEIIMGLDAIFEGRNDG
ncbi:hypothetical protein EU404_20155 [Salmonella enterica subsp. enterica serovar Weltevreden]|nr:hypothetical protein [Salmonella enterica subsp. enterica serovar Weltevreden]